MFEWSLYTLINNIVGNNAKRMLNMRDKFIKKFWLFIVFINCVHSVIVDTKTNIDVMNNAENVYNSFFITSVEQFKCALFIYDSSVGNVSPIVLSWWFLDASLTISLLFYSGKQREWRISLYTKESCSNDRNNVLEFFDFQIGDLSRFNLTFQLWFNH